MARPAELWASPIVPVHGASHSQDVPPSPIPGAAAGCLVWPPTISHASQLVAGLHGGAGGGLH